MANKNQVVWKEGLFIKPQHFQYQQLANELTLDERIRSLNPFAFGFTELSLDSELLRLGHVSIKSAAGVMPDGSLFRFPLVDSVPSALAVENERGIGEIVYLTLPMLGTNGGSETLKASNAERYTSVIESIFDWQSAEGSVCEIEVMKLAPTLKLGSDNFNNYSRLGLCKIKHKRPDGSLVLDEDFLPTFLNIKASPVIDRFLHEVYGLMRERAAQLATRFVSSESKSVLDQSDWALLQLLNRLGPRFGHLSEVPFAHPERVYELLIEAIGELSTFTDASRLPPERQAYNHAEPGAAFVKMIGHLRQSLSTVLEPKALTIQLDSGARGILYSSAIEVSLLNKFDLFLIVKADMPIQELVDQFLKRVKIASQDQIEELVQIQVPGIPLLQLTVPPRELPLYSGFAYFRLDKKGDAWDNMEGGTGFGIHIAGELPGLEVELWAVKI